MRAQNCDERRYLDTYRTVTYGTVPTVGRYRTCYDMATYPCIYVYDAPGINPAAFGSYGAGIYIPKLGLVPKHVRPVRPVANLYDLLAS